MSGTNSHEEQVIGNISPNQVDDEKTSENPTDSDKIEENSMPSAQEEEEAIKKKYGGVMRKKAPLISQDHERAYFDSADWALEKQGGKKPKGPLEALRPKLEPTPHQQLRSRLVVSASTDDGGVDSGSHGASADDESCKPSDNNNENKVED